MYTCYSFQVALCSHQIDFIISFSLCCILFESDQYPKHGKISFDTFFIYFGRKLIPLFANNSVCIQKPFLTFFTDRTQCPSFFVLSYLLNPLILVTLYIFLSSQLETILQFFKHSITRLEVLMSNVVSAICAIGSVAGARLFRFAELSKTSAISATGDKSSSKSISFL